MLKLVLETIEAAQGPVHVAELSQQLGIQLGALEGMIDFWVRKGRLLDEDGLACSPTTGGCGGSCTGTANCGFIAKMPRSWTLE